MSKINEILEGILALNGDDFSNAVVHVAVRKDNGAILGAGLTEDMAMGCAMAVYCEDMLMSEQRKHEANASNLVSLVKVPLW
jgi:hypothetical protein